MHLEIKEMKMLNKILLVLLISIASVATAQDFPNGPIKIVTNLPVGSAPDVMARKVAELLSAEWHVPVMIDNRPGANGVIALEYYLKDTDPRNIYMADFGAYVVMPLLYKKQSEMIQLQVLWPFYSNYWVVATSGNITTWDQLKTELSKKSFYGSWGVGSAGHYCGAEIANQFNIVAQHVPYKDYGVWFGDIVNNNLTFSCTSVGSSEQYKKSGKLNWLAITAPKRDPNFPDIPTIRELTGHEFKTYGGFITFFVNKNLEHVRRQKLQNDIQKILQNPELKKLIQQQVRGTTWHGSVKQFEQQLQQDQLNYERLTNKFGIQIN